MSSETFNEILYGDSGSLTEWKKRFVSEAESNQQIVDLLKKQRDAEKALASLELKLGQLADRFQELSGTMRRHLAKPPTDLNPGKDEAFGNSLRFGEESGVNVDGLFEKLRERARLTFAIEDCKRLIRQLT
jgi:hypothetical protein